MSTVHFSDDDLERLSKSCPNLKSVNLFNLKSLSIDGLGFLSTLPHLETIHLGWQYCSKSRETRASAKNALKIIPHLKEISQEEFNEEDFLTIPSTPQPTFSLEVLKMNATGSVENLAACVPNLKWVQLLLKYLIPPEVLSQLPYLSSFAMNCSDEREWPLVFNYLTVLGPRLTRLEVVDCMYAGENLYTILLLCPNLEYLNVEDPLGSTVQCAAKSIDFKKLKLRELHLVSLEVPLSRHQAYWPLLQAPELHTVTLHRFCFTYPKKVANIKGPLLQNLVNFECSFSKFASPAAFDHYIQFCICISHLAELPQVGKVLVHF